MVVLVVGAARVATGREVQGRRVGTEVRGQVLWWLGLLWCRVGRLGGGLGRSRRRVWLPPVRYRVGRLGVSLLVGLRVGCVG